MPIPFIMPTHFSLNENKERSAILSSINYIHSSKKISKNSIFLDFSHVNKIEPDAITYMAHNLRISKKKNILLKCSNSVNINMILHNLVNFCSKRELNNDQFINESYHYFGHDATFGDEYDRIESVLFRFFNQNIAHDINNAISEAVSNITEHAYDKATRHKGWLLFLYITNTSMSIIISDLGKTIPKNLLGKTIPKNLLNEDRYMKSLLLSYINKLLPIQLKITDMTDHQLIRFVTNKPTKHDISISAQTDNRGQGFIEMQRVCTNITGARMFIHSRHGYWCSDDMYKSYNEPINGTTIGWRIPLQQYNELSVIQVA